MKRTLLSLTAVLVASTSMADIQDPPMNDHGPTRKLGRGWANLLFSFTEVPSSIDRINTLEGNAAAATYGVVRGFGRFFYRIGAGVHDIFTFPFPTYRRSFRPPYKSDVPWVNGGYEEFPPELGFQTRKPYTTNTTAY